jgi:hypothetical protein
VVAFERQNPLGPGIDVSKFGRQLRNVHTVRLSSSQ